MKFITSLIFLLVISSCSYPDDDYSMRSNALPLSNYSLINKTKTYSVATTLDIERANFNYGDERSRSAGGFVFEYSYLGIENLSLSLNWVLFDSFFINAQYDFLTKPNDYKLGVGVNFGMDNGEVVFGMNLLGVKKIYETPYNDTLSLLLDLKLQRMNYIVESWRKDRDVYINQKDMLIAMTGLEYEGKGSQNKSAIFLNFTVGLEKTLNSKIIKDEVPNTFKRKDGIRTAFTVGARF